MHFQQADLKGVTTFGLGLGYAAVAEALLVIRGIISDEQFCISLVVHTASFCCALADVKRSRRLS